MKMSRNQSRKVGRLKQCLDEALWELKEARDYFENPEIKDCLRGLRYIDTRKYLKNILSYIRAVPYFPQKFLARAEEIRNQITNHPNDKYYRDIKSWVA